MQKELEVYRSRGQKHIKAQNHDQVHIIRMIEKKQRPP